MAVVQWARRFTCDSCQVAADVIEPWKEPAGWTNVPLGLDSLWWNINLCPDCSATPFSTMVGNLERRFERKAVPDGDHG